MSLKICSVEGCGSKHKGKSYCEKHLLRFNKYGDPLTVIRVSSREHGEICSVEGCEGKHKGHGYCNSHYGRFRKHGNPLVNVPIAVFVYDEICSVGGCEREHVAKGYCSGHYQRFMTHGDPLKGGAEISGRNFDNNGKCSVEGCRGAYKSRGYCAKHYKRLTDHGDVLKSSRNYENNGKCSIENCDSEYHQHDLCKKHFRESNLSRLQVKVYGHKRRSLKRNSMVNDFTAKDWSKSLNHFNNECAYCGCTDKQIHQEHVVPISRGGSNTITNIIPACETCNTSKGSTLIEKWYPKKPFYSKQRETKIYKWMGYTVNQDTIQATLF
ncbi:HNH endonuclease [Paenibacillus sp. LjRoot56]|uniref:HNH endonuclease n=1 Tax=Paenibacillus sp. LjRoot56 TaxID=3342333 RepID=UPI003ECF2FF6